MRKFERWLLTAVLLLLAGSLGLYYWRLNRPVFVRTPFTETEREIMVAVGSDTLVRYRINQRLLSNAQPCYSIDHYQWGELVNQIPEGGGLPFYQMEPKNRLTDLYISFNRESEVAPGMMHLGFEQASLGQRFSVPQHDYVHFASPERVPFKVDEPMLMALVAFSDQPIDADTFSGKTGPSLLEEASQYPDVFVYTLEFVQVKRVTLFKGSCRGREPGSRPNGVVKEASGLTCSQSARLSMVSLRCGVGGVR